MSLEKGKDFYASIHFLSSFYIKSILFSSNPSPHRNQNKILYYHSIIFTDIIEIISFLLVGDQFFRYKRQIYCVKELTVI